MAYPHKVEMVWVGGRWWWFPGRQISVESQFEWKNGTVYLLESDGSAVEGILMPSIRTGGAIWTRMLRVWFPFREYLFRENAGWLLGTRSHKANFGKKKTC